jgi:hypothetical protein
MTYHAVTGNNVLRTLKEMFSEHRMAWLFVAIFTYGCLIAAMTAKVVEAEVKPDFPVFNCQEDELMVWANARKTAVCINIEEYQEAVTP